MEVCDFALILKGPRLRPLYFNSCSNKQYEKICYSIVGNIRADVTLSLSQATKFLSSCRTISVSLFENFPTWIITIDTTSASSYGDNIYATRFVFHGCYPLYMLSPFKFFHRLSTTSKHLSYSPQYRTFTSRSVNTFPSVPPLVHTRLHHSFSTLPLPPKSRLVWTWLLLIFNIHYQNRKCILHLTSSTGDLVSFSWIIII